MTSIFRIGYFITSQPSRPLIQTTQPSPKVWFHNAKLHESIKWHSILSHCKTNREKIIKLETKKKEKKKKKKKGRIMVTDNKRMQEMTDQVRLSRWKTSDLDPNFKHAMRYSITLATGKRVAGECQWKTTREVEDRCQRR